MTVVVIGDGPVAADIFGLFERAGLPAVRVAVADAAQSEAVASAELIIDACSLPVQAKRDLFWSLERSCSSDAVICSDESVAPRQELLEGLDPSLRRRFAICHFFVPTASLALVEFITGGEIDPGAESRLLSVLEGPAQRSIVRCPDTPGFIANRIGLFFAFRGAKLAISHGIRPDHADQILASRFGLPRLGVFGLFDLLGFDVMNAIKESLQARLPQSDAWQGCGLGGDVMPDAARQTAGGLRFYRKDKITGERSVLDLKTRAFVSCSSGTVAANGEAEFVAQLNSELGAYCAHLAESTGVAADVIDSVVCKGFGWRRGPFALLKGAGRAG